MEQGNDILRVWREDPDRGLRLLIDAYAGPVWKIVRHRLAGAACEADMEETVNDIFLEIAEKAERVDEAKGALTAFRYVVSAEPKKAFSFQVSEDTMRQLSECAERYILAMTATHFHTLDYYHQAAALES